MSDLGVGMTDEELTEAMLDEETDEEPDDEWFLANNYGPHVNEWARERITTLKDENARLRAVLEQYADEGNWARLDGDHCPPSDWWMLDGNGYDLARKALKEQP
jgi:hypothetical protein